MKSQTVSLTDRVNPQARALAAARALIELAERKATRERLTTPTEGWTTRTDVAPKPRRRTRRQADVRLVDRDTPRFEVELGHWAWGRIEEEIRDVLGAFGSTVEAGGYLLADRSNPWFIHTVANGRDTKHGPTSVLLDDSEAVALEVEDPELVTVGSWHSHPDSGDVRPSGLDMRSSRASAFTRAHPAWVGLIVLPNDEGCGFMMPRPVAWVTTDEGDGDWVCEPAAVTLM